MSITFEGNRVLVNGDIEGSVFPKGEADVARPVVIDSTREGRRVRVDGAVYGRDLLIRGDVEIKGPVVSRGDARLEPRGGRLRLSSGIVVRGSLSAEGGAGEGVAPATDVKACTILVKGDIVANQSVVLRNAVVFGSIRAQHATIINCVVLGTIVVEEQLTVSMSTIAGYLARDVTFEGSCSLIYAIGESAGKPLFIPHEGVDGTITPADMRFYPCLRATTGLLRSRESAPALPPESRLDAASDWVLVNAQRDLVVESGNAEPFSRWVLSLGGRVADLRRLTTSVEALTGMLRCGFEYEHYQPAIRKDMLDKALAALNADERWILAAVCG